MGFENCVTLKKVEVTGGGLKASGLLRKGRAQLMVRRKYMATSCGMELVPTQTAAHGFNFPLSGIGKRRGHSKTESKGKCLYQLLMRYERHHA